MKEREVKKIREWTVDEPSFSIARDIIIIHTLFGQQKLKITYIYIFCSSHRKSAGRLPLVRRQNAKIKFPYRWPMKNFLERVSILVLNKQGVWCTMDSK